MDPNLHLQLAQSTDTGNPIVFLLIAVVGYLLVTVPIYKMAERLNQENPWLAFVPIANLYLICMMAGKEWWWLLLLFIPLINIVIVAILWMGIAGNLGHPSWLGLLMFIPLVNLALLYYFAFGPAPAARY